MTAECTSSEENSLVGTNSIDLGDSTTQALFDICCVRTIIARALQIFPSFRYRQPILNLDRALVNLNEVIAMTDRLKALPPKEHVKVSVCLSLLVFFAKTNVSIPHRYSTPASITATIYHRQRQ